MTGSFVIVLLNIKPKKIRNVMSNGFLLTASDNTVIELVTPPTGTKVGEVIQVAGLAVTVEVLNDNAIQKVKNDLKTNNDCIATYRGIPLTTSAGACTVNSLKGAQLS